MNEFDDDAGHAFTDIAFGAGLIVISLADVGLFAGRTMLEKTLTSLFMPCGLLWLMLAATTWFLLAAKRRRHAFLVGSCWLLLTAAGNLFVSQWLVGNLEQPYLQIDAMSGNTYDLGVLLGGGTSTRVSGVPELEANGDRVATAARLYHAGKVKRIICTGSRSPASNPNTMHPREEAAKILIELNIPEDDIIRIEGKNTSEEMKNLHRWLDSQSIDDDGTIPPPKIGIITSAWHLPRALRLAANNGVQAYPLPADFHTESTTLRPSFVIPGAFELSVSRIAIKEYLARLVGR